MSIELQAQGNTAALAQIKEPGKGTEALLKIRVKVRSVYGLDKVYVESFHSGPLSILTGQKTLTASSIQALKSLGYVFEGLEG